MGNVCGVLASSAEVRAQPTPVLPATTSHLAQANGNNAQSLPNGPDQSKIAPSVAAVERNACPYSHLHGTKHAPRSHVLSPESDDALKPSERTSVDRSTLSAASLWTTGRATHAAPALQPEQPLSVIASRSTTSQSRPPSALHQSVHSQHALATPSPAHVDHSSFGSSLSGAGVPLIQPRPLAHTGGVSSPFAAGRGGTTGSQGGCVFAHLAQPSSGTPGAPDTPGLSGGSSADSPPDSRSYQGTGTSGPASVGYSDFGSSSSVRALTLEERIASASVSMAGFGGSGSLPLSQLIDVLPTAIVGTDREGIIQMANRHAEELFGYEHGELQGKAIEVLVPAHVRDEHKALREMYQADPTARPMGPLSKGGQAGRQLSGQRKDGSVFPIEAGLSPLPPESGGLTLAAVVDVTGRVREEERLRMVVEAAPSGMVLVDSQGTITLVNRALETMFGYTRAQILGQRVEMLIHPRYRAQHVRWRTEYTRCPSARSMGVGRDLYGLKSDGTEFPVEIGLQPIQAARDSGTPAAPKQWPSSAGSYLSSPGLGAGASARGRGRGRQAPPTWVLAAVVDISERKRAEELARAVDVAQRAIKSRGEILTHMSHELRTPLHGVIGTASLLGEVLTHPEHKAMLDTITKCADITLAVINDILDFSKIDAGRLDIETVEFEPKALLADIDSLFRTTALRKGLRYTLECSGNVPAVLLGDPTRIRQILVNVTSNALKFTPTGGSVSVKLLGEPCMIDVDVAGRMTKRRSHSVDHHPNANAHTGNSMSTGSDALGGSKSTSPPDSASSGPLQFQMPSDTSQQEVLVAGTAQHQSATSSISQSTAHTGGFLLRGVITDTGPGISAAAQESIFDPFVQGDTSTTRRFGGTGLGLAICKRIAGLMGGDIVVRSAAGQGATFEFWVATGWDASATATRSSEQSSSPTGIDHTGLSASIAASASGSASVPFVGDPISDFALASLAADTGESPLVVDTADVAPPQRQADRPRLEHMPGHYPPALSPTHRKRDEVEQSGGRGSNNSSSSSSKRRTPRGSGSTLVRPTSGSGPDSGATSVSSWLDDVAAAGGSNMSGKSLSESRGSSHGTGHATGYNGEAGVRAKLEIEVAGQKTADAAAAARSPRRSPTHRLDAPAPARVSSVLAHAQGGTSTRRFSAFHEPATPEVAQQASTATANSASGKATILVADDNPVNVRLAKAFVVKAGYTPVLAMDGLQAVQLWAKHCMPGQHIGEALRNIGHAALPLGETGASAASLRPAVPADSHGRGQTAPVPTTPAGDEQGAGSSSAETTARSSTSSALTGSTRGGTTTSVSAIDAVLMDCEMPVLSGFDAALCIRELERMEGKGRHTSIIAVTASAMTGDRERCLAAGMDGYLAKPVRYQQLRAKIEKHLSTTAQAPGQPGTTSEHGQATAEV